MQKRGLDLLPRPSLSNLSEIFHDLRDFLRPTRDRWQDASRHGNGRSYYETIEQEEESRPLHEGNENRSSIEDDNSGQRTLHAGEHEDNAW